MFTVLIADDEKIIREGLRHAVENSSLDYQVAAEAEDGMQALELALQYQPQLLFVDICMPRMNGLELISRLRTQLPYSKIIIISGYDDFDYVREALRMNVYEYLLKPVSPAQLQEILTRAWNDIRREMEKNNYQHFVHQYLQDNQDLLRNRFLVSLAEGQIPSERMEQELQLLGLAYSGNGYLFVLNPIVDFGGGNENLPIPLELLEQVRQEIQQSWPFQPMCWSFLMGRLLMIVGFYTQSEELVKMQQWVEQTAGRQTTPMLVSGEEIGSSPRGIVEACRRASASPWMEKEKNPVVFQAMQYLEEHYQEADLSQQAVADAVGVSVSYLSKLFKKELSITFIDCLSMIRSQKAKQLLRNPALKIYEIAQMVGYNSQHYFCTAFKRIYKISPMEYRKLKE
ncbi:MAG: response regulator transcription factor [Eubacteriales bacterium]|jgi:two-component system response regulator YesN